VIQGDAKFKANFIYAGGLLTKSKNLLDASGIGSKIDLSEFAFGNGDQRFDLSTFIINSKPMSTARLESGAVLDGKSNCMLKGYAKVDKGTKGCVSKITERGILLSKDAHVDALPDMSIDYSNEVKATHSAATSPIDRESLFYLETRGLEEKQARKMFITAFLGKYVSNMSSGVAHEVAMSVMLEKLDNGSFGVMPDVTARGAWMSSR
jgi:Fe-S cluster assembly protein SufD